MRNLATRNWAIPALVVGLGTVLLSVSGCKIVPNDQRASVAVASTNAGQAGASSSAFDAPAYVDSVWEKELVPFFTSKSSDMSIVVKEIAADFDAAGGKYGHRADAEGSPWSFAVRATAKVLAVNTESRAGTVDVEISSPEGALPVALQIGPVVKGTAIRDVVPFFSFEKVTNQIEFAQVGRSFNERAMKEIKDKVGGLKAGDQIEFLGAFSATAAPEKYVVTPVSIKAGAAK